MENVEILWVQPHGSVRHFVCRLPDGVYYISVLVVKSETCPSEPQITREAYQCLREIAGLPRNTRLERFRVTMRVLRTSIPQVWEEIPLELREAMQERLAMEDL